MSPIRPDPGEALAAVVDLFDVYPGPWMVTGGWALDLFAGRVRREHTDVDIMIRSDDVALFAATYADRAPRVVDHRTGGVEPWRRGMRLVTGRHTLTIDAETPPLEIVLADGDGDDWVFHRGNRIRRQWRLITLRTGDGLPFLAPEVVLLFKTRGERDRDEHDFADIAPLLHRERLEWLRARLTPPGRDHHPWAAELDKLLDEDAARDDAP